MHVSLDGMVAGPNGEMNWITVDEELFDYAADRTDHSDTALYGRVTYDMMEGYWPTAGDKPNASKHDKHHSAWYKQVQKIVLSRTLKNAGPKTTVISDNLVAEINQLKQTDGNEIIIFGSPSAVHALAAEDLIDEYWLFVNPVLIGQGMPMFQNIKHRTNLRLVKSHALSNGVVCLHYERKR